MSDNGVTDRKPLPQDKKDEVHKHLSKAALELRKAGMICMEGDVRGYSGFFRLSEYVSNIAVEDDKK